MNKVQTPEMAAVKNTCGKKPADHALCVADTGPSHRRRWSDRVDNSLSKRDTCETGNSVGAVGRKANLKWRAMSVCRTSKTAFADVDESQSVVAPLRRIQ